MGRQRTPTSSARSPSNAPWRPPRSRPRRRPQRRTGQRPRPPGCRGFGWRFRRGAGRRRCRRRRSVKIILSDHVDRLGNDGDLLDVADGYARNYLLPRGLALAATTGALAQAESMREARSRRDAADRESAEAVRDRLSSSAVRIPAQSGTDGRLFGSVTAADVADAVIAQLGVELDRKR